MAPSMMVWLIYPVCLILPVFATPLSRCRTTADLGRIPWFLPNSTFYNLGHPLVQALCENVTEDEPLSLSLNCGSIKHVHYLQESVKGLRYNEKSSTIIIDPHCQQSDKVPSSGAFVINAMFQILYDLGYKPAARHWSDSMNNLFPEYVAAAAMNISHQFEAYEKTQAPNPFKDVSNYIALQIEVAYELGKSVSINDSPYGRTFRWIVGLHFNNRHPDYAFSAPTSHCAGANYFLGRGMLCSTSGVISCPQYDFHQTQSLAVTAENRGELKKNIILFDNDQAEIDYIDLGRDIKLLGGVDDLQVLFNIGRKKTDMPDLYKRIKMTIDCRNPGVEFINYEATLYDVMTLSCDMRATRNIFDFPVPSKYHINTRNWTHLVKQVHHLLTNYEKHIDDFKHFKRLSRSSNQLAKKQMDIHFFSRDVMFRTRCDSYAECRRVFPWAVAVWTLYPMARIEVVANVDIAQFRLDNDLILDNLPQEFNSKYFSVYNGIAGVAPVDMFPRAPCAYTVYMDPSFIPFGRDFLNTHVAALVKDPRPIVYWREAKLVLSIQHARPSLKVFRETGGGRTIYVETDYTIRAIGNYDTYTDLQKYNPEVPVLGTAYLNSMKRGEDFYQGHLEKWLQKYPDMPQRPCDDTNSRFNSSHKAHGVDNNKHHMHHAHLKNLHRSYHNTNHRCAPPDHLVIDAIYVPMSHIDDDQTETHAEPTLWLTSSSVPLTIKSVFETFTKQQIESIVQHLDPLLQNALMQRIISYIPSDISQTLKLFDAVNYPNVISLIDMEHPRWGEKC